MRPTLNTERHEFLDALALWDRPEEELRQKALDADVDVDAFVERAVARMVTQVASR